MENIQKKTVDLSQEAPFEEPRRQYYYIEKAKQYIAEKEQKLGRKLTFCVTTLAVR